jgi:hypothetical protein
VSYSTSVGARRLKQYGKLTARELTSVTEDLKDDSLLFTVPSGEEFTPLKRK